MPFFKRSRSWAVLVASLLTLSLFLAACGDATSTPASTAATTAAATNPTTAASSATTAAGATSAAATTAAGATSAAATTAAGATTAAAAGGGGGTMVGGFDVGPGGNFGLFNPMTAGGGASWYNKYFSTLLLYDVNFQKMQGDLAESWEVSADGKQVTFHLRKGLTWQDGQPLTSDDVKFSIDLLKNPDSLAITAGRYKAVKEITTPDPQTVVFNLDQPSAPLLDALTLSFIYPKHALAAITPKDLVKSSWWSTNPIGSGPFKWSKYVPDQYVELLPFDNYWRGKPKLDKLINRYFKDSSSALIALRSGDIQFTYVTSDEAGSLKSDQSVTVIPGPSQVLNYLGFNQKDKRFQDVRVRQAFMYAIDRKAIVDQLYKGTAQLVPCGYNNPNYLPSDVNSYPRDVNKAKELLKAANWDSIKGQPIDLLTYYSDQLSTDVLTTIQQMLAEAGIDAKPRAVDVPTFNQARTSSNFQVFYGGAGNGPDPDILGASLMSTTQLAQVAGINNPDLDKLYVQGQQETDPAKRALVYQNVCKVMNQEVMWGPMWVAQRFGAVSKKVSNFIWTPAPGGGRYYDAPETWTLSK